MSFVNYEKRDKTGVANGKEYILKEYYTSERFSTRAVAKGKSENIPLAYTLSCNYTIRWKCVFEGKE